MIDETLKRIAMNQAVQYLSDHSDAKVESVAEKFKVDAKKLRFERRKQLQKKGSKK